MGNDNFEKLADALDRLPNGFPRTPEKIEIRMLKKIFSDEEAAIASHLTEELETADEIARKLNLPAEETITRLKEMTENGMLWLDTMAFGSDYDFETLMNQENPRFRLAPFIPGILETFAEEKGDHEFMHLMEAYFAAGGAAGIMQPNPAIQRVVPSQNAVIKEWILPYDDVKNILADAKSFYKYQCTCRILKDISGRKCDHPTDNCLYFSSIGHAHDNEPGMVKISQQEALTILKQSDEDGLVHTVTNVMKGIGYLCNCCGCCCVSLRGITEWGIENSVAVANYFAVVDPEKCILCETCIQRCQVQVISAGEDSVVIDKSKCIGCGLCVSGCPEEAVTLQKKPDNEIVHPPDNYKAWEQQRKASRKKHDGVI